MSRESGVGSGEWGVATAAVAVTADKPRRATRAPRRRRRRRRPVCDGAVADERVGERWEEHGREKNAVKSQQASEGFSYQRFYYNREAVVVVNGRAFL